VFQPKRLCYVVQLDIFLGSILLAMFY